MKGFLYLSISLFSLLFALPPFGTAQAPSDTAPDFGVYKIYPPISLSRAELAAAQTLVDLNKYYKPSWVETYFSVEFSTTVQGKIQKVVGKEGKINKAQKALLKSADSGSPILVKVDYLPKNNLSHNDPKEINFTLMVEPDKEAQYPGGEQALRSYLKQKAIDKIPKGSIVGWDLAAIRFTVSEVGEISAAEVTLSSKNEAIDSLLLESVRSMPCWEAASYQDGTSIKQDFALTVGNPESCSTYILNIRRDLPD